MDQINYALEGLVFDIQRFSVNDGPGIRTIVFLSGCPLRCQWCANPESQLLRPVVMYNELECIHCGICVSACKHGAISPQNKGMIDRTKCVGCGECSMACPAGALIMKGKRMTVEEVIKELKKDGTHYRRSGGGLTISGGEPLVQHEFTLELLKAAHAQGWNTAIETTAHADEEIIRKVLPHVDLSLTDVKSMDAKKHEYFTGVSNEKILKGVKLISEITDIMVRVPVIPGVNEKKEDILQIAEFAKTLNQGHLRGINLLPYHSMGENKYKMLGRDYKLHGLQMMNKDDINVLKESVEQTGIPCKIG